MHPVSRDAYLLYVNNKPMAILPGLETSKRVAERVATAQPTTELILRLANPRRCEAGHPLVKDATPTWSYDARTQTWQKLSPPCAGPINDRDAL